MYKTFIFFNAKNYCPHNNTYSTYMTLKKQYNLNKLPNIVIISLTFLSLINQLNDNSLNLSLIFFPTPYLPRYYQHDSYH